MSKKRCSKSNATLEPEGFDLEDYVRRSAEASHVPLRVEDVGVLSDVAAMVTPPSEQKDHSTRQVG